jgi:hypothetical protein
LWGRTKGLRLVRVYQSVTKIVHEDTNLLTLSGSPIIELREY